MAADLQFRAIDQNEGAFTTVHGTRHGVPHRYEVIAPRGITPGNGDVLGYVYKVEVNVMGATYTVWHAEPEIDQPFPSGYPTRRQAAEALRP